MSGADAWVARDSPAARGAPAEAVLYSEIGVGDPCGAGSTVPAAAVSVEAGKGVTGARSGAGCPPICSRSALAPIPTTSAITLAPM
jgi:hypothetical protein